MFSKTAFEINDDTLWEPNICLSNKVAKIKLNYRQYVHTVTHTHTFPNLYMVNGQSIKFITQ